MSVASFYADDHLGARFANPGPLWPWGHRGQDVYRWPAGTRIPSWCSGTVVGNTSYTKLGWTLIVRRPDGLYVGYCHLLKQSPYKVGARIDIGTHIGQVGSTGTASTGPHLHTTLEPTAVIGTAKALDPLPGIKAARTTPAGGGVTPIPDPPKPIVRDYPMRVIYNLDAPAAEEDTRRAIIGELSFQVITGPQSTRERKFWGDPVNVTVGEWNAARDLVVARRRELGLPVVIEPNGSVCGGLTDTQAQTLAAIAETLANLRVPSAAENGAAARNAMIKD